MPMPRLVGKGVHVCVCSCVVVCICIHVFMFVCMYVFVWVLCLCVRDLGISVSCAFSISPANLSLGIPNSATKRQELLYLWPSQTQGIGFGESQSHLTNYLSDRPHTLH